MWNICNLIRYIDQDALTHVARFVFSAMNIKMPEMLFELTAHWHKQLLLTARKEALGKKRVHLN